MNGVLGLAAADCNKEASGARTLLQQLCMASYVGEPAVYGAVNTALPYTKCDQTLCCQVLSLRHLTQGAASWLT